MNLDPSGGQGIGPDATGSDYPFLSPGPDVAGFLADLYLAYPDDAVLPLSIAWLYGMDRAYNGTDGPAPDVGSGVAYAATHAVDVVVVDAAGALVFDSTTATSFRGGAFGARLAVYEWADALSVCRLVQHTAVADASRYRPRPRQVWPVDGRLDARCTAQAPRRLLAVQGLAGDLALVGGRNTTLTASPGPPGPRRRTRLTLAMAPGSGLGRQPGCSDVTVLAGAVGGVTGDARGNLAIAAEGCYWARPAVAAGALAHGRLRLGNDCRPCCDCADHALLAAAIVAAFNRLAALGTLAAEAACRFAALIARWDAQKACRESATVRLNALPFGAYVEVRSQVCNASDTCLDAVVLSVAFASTAPVAVVAGTAVVTDGLGHAALGDPGATPGVAAFAFALVPPGGTATADFRLAVTLAAGAAADVTITASAAAGGHPLPGTVTRTVTARN